MNMVTLKRSSLEPGLLSVFRLFVGIQWGVYVFELVPRLAHLALGLPLDRGPHSARGERVLWLIHMALGMPYYEVERLYPHLLFSLAIMTLLMVYLWWLRIQRRLGRGFLPGGLLIATIGPLVGEYLKFMAIYRSAALDAMVMVEVWQLALVLFVPLVLIAWQYGLRAVALFCLGTVALDLILKTAALGLDNPYMLPIAGAILVRTVLYAMVGYMIVRLATSQRQQRRALAQANVQLAHYATTLEQLATSRERNRLARELHDTLAHTLSEIAVELEATKTVWDTDPLQARAIMERSLTATRAGLTETRRALQALRAAPLEDLGLALAVRSLAESAATQSGATLDWQGPARIEAISPPLEQCIYRVAQEALENAARHAGARHLVVRLAQDQGRLTLQVSDDGCGFEVGKVEPNHRLGLKGMRERAEMVGGILEVDSRPGGGTTVRLAVEEQRDSGPDL